MLQDLINEYIDAMHEANLKKMVRLEKDINALGMDSMTLRVTVKELEKEKKVS